MKEGWVYKTLGECCDINYGTRVVRQKDGGTIYDVYGGGGATFKMDIFNREDCVVIARFAMSKQCTRYVSGKFYLNDSGLTVSPKTDSQLSQLLLNKLLLALNDTIYSYGRGSAQRNLNVKEFIKIPIAFPKDVTEQQRIVSYLDAEFAKIEALKANAEKQLQAAKDLFQAALKELLTPKEGWVEKKLGDYATLITKGASPKWQGFQYQNSGIPFITSENVRDGFIDISPRKFLPRDFNAKQKRSILKKHDVLVNIVGASIGRAAIFDLDYSDANINQAVALVRCNAKIEVKYLCMFLNSEMASKQYDFYKKDSARANLSLENISSLSISCPSLSAQQRIADRLDALSANVKALQTNYTETITLCNDLKQALLKKVFG